MDKDITEHFKFTDPDTGTWKYTGDKPVNVTFNFDSDHEGKYKFCAEVNGEMQEPICQHIQVGKNYVDIEVDVKDGDIVKLKSMLYCGDKL